MKLLIPPPVYALMIAALMWLLNRYIPGAQLISAPWNKAGLLVILVAIMSDFWSIRLFLKKHTTANPMKPQNTTGLITTGLYKISRNPMYMGLLTVLAGYAIYLGSLTPFLGLPVYYFIVTEMQIKPEEAILEDKFGQEYLDYKSKVRRWL